MIAAVDNPQDICVISSRPYGHRAVLKFASHTNATAVAGKFTPGNFTNYVTRSFKEPRLIIVTDPRTDHQAITEASYVNIPVIALCDTDSPLVHVDCAIPVNNKARNSIGLAWWLLAREVLRLRGSLPDRQTEWEIMPDMYFYRSPEDEEKDMDENREGEDDFEVVEPEVAAAFEVSGAAVGGIPVAAVSGGAGGAGWDAEPSAVDWSEAQAPSAGANNWD